MSSPSDRMKQWPHIPEEILVQILRCLPRKSRSRFKCVSKKWRYLLSDRNLMIPKTSKSGLVFQCLPYNMSPTSSIFLRLDNRGGASIDNSILCSYWGYRICGSCNGFLLLHNRSFEVETAMYLVINPITNFSQRVASPTPTHINFDGVGLVFDGKIFKVVFYSGSAIKSRLVFDVYSLEDKKWRRKGFQYPHGHGCLSFSSHGQPLFFKNAVHWMLQKHLLIYHLQDEFCKLIELPSVNKDRYLELQHIWAFEGQLHYFTVKGNKVDIWVLDMEDQNYIPSRKQCFKTQHKHSSVLQLPNHPYSWPFAFNEDLETLYLKLDDKVLSYIPDTRELKVVYVCPRDGKSLNPFEHVGFPFLYVSD